jgi:hypothetical protein
MGRGRPPGVSNKEGHKAGGARKKKSKSVSAVDKNQSTLLDFPRNQAPSNVGTSSSGPGDTLTLNVEDHCQFPIQGNEGEQLSNAVDPFSVTAQDRTLLVDDDECEPTPNFIKKYLLEVQESIKKENILSKGIRVIRNGSLWICPPDPIVLNTPINDPKKWLLPKIFLWFPRIMRPDLNVHCPECGGINTVVQEWSKTCPARRVIGLFENYYIMSRRYRCTDCSGEEDSKEGENRYTFMPYDPDVLKYFPESVVSLFPALLSHRSGLDISILNMMHTLMSHWTTAAEIESMQENHWRLLDSKHLSYLQHICTKKGELFSGPPAESNLTFGMQWIGSKCPNTMRLQSSISEPFGTPYLSTMRMISSESTLYCEQKGRKNSEC